jgi:hypothetical protein
MKIWDVFAGDHFIGSVEAETEERALEVACCRCGEPHDVFLSVHRRTDEHLLSRCAPRRRQIPLLAVFISVSLFCVSFALWRQGGEFLFWGISAFGAAVGVPIGHWKTGNVKGTITGVAVGWIAGPAINVLLRIT